ncbi:Galactokinase [Schizosaccharomyces pombe]
MATVPTYHDLSFYSNPKENKARYAKLLNSFEQKYHCKPDFFSRSPGRVNIIGEHIDYNYFSVLPMAIDVDVIVSVTTSDDAKVELNNTNPEFKEEILELPSDGAVIEINKTHHTWGNYFRCSMIVAHKYILEKYPELVSGGKKPLKGLKLIFDGNVPTGGGLSSSAAFCVASILAILKANGINTITKEDLVKISVVSEHYVGVNTGGMDQCASIYGEQNKALLVQFKPKLMATPFKMPVLKPHDMVFLISNTLVEANKQETASTNYNLRVVEMAVASEFLAKKFNLELPKESNLHTGTLRGFMDEYYEKHLKQPRWDGSDIDMGVQRMQEMLRLTEIMFSEEQKVGFKTEELAKELGLSVEEFTKVFLTKIPVKYDRMKIYQRTVHVYSDAMRVLQVLKLFHQHKDSDDPQKFMLAFGRLLNDSQRSEDIYNNSSSPELREVCKISLANGGYGARTTGAGWGGSAVHLTTHDKLAKLVEALTEQYYKKQFPKITQSELNAAVVVSKPAAGSCIVQLAEY